MEIFSVIRSSFIVLLLFHSTAAGANGSTIPSASEGQLTTHQSTHNQTHSDQCSQHSQWFCFNSTTKAYKCSQIQHLIPTLPWPIGIKCLESGPSMISGYCATYNDDTRVLSISPSCGYFQYGAYNVTAPGYIQLPTILTELDDYMCGPLHRKGLLCSECADGYGPSVTSYWHRCVNCADAWYGVPLFLLVEFVPITIFYLLVVIFQIRLTSTPMPCFIMLAQIYIIALEGVHPTGQSVEFTETKDGYIRLQDIKIAHVLYSFFNLDFFLSILPPFCISIKLKFFHIILFGYISVFYPIFLIGVTWLCVELHGRNYRLFKWLWRPFQLCFAKLKKQGLNTKSDLVDVFATFFLLSYNKCIYQTQMYYGSGLYVVVDIDESGNHNSVHGASIDGTYTSTYFGFLFPILCVSILFCLLPPILLICYPFKCFRSCLSKCHLDVITVNTFVENFHGCYRNGLDGGCDMRSFSGLYFVLRIVVCLVPYVFSFDFKKHSFYYSGVTFLIVALTIALVKPYKKPYANYLDTLILTDLALMCFYYTGSSLFVWQILPRILLLAPIVIFIAIILLKMIHKIFRLCGIKVSPCQCYKLCVFRRASRSELGQSSALMSTASAEQPLISPTVPVVNKCYGALSDN